MRIDFTLTLPGMFEIGRIQQLAKELGVEILAKVIFSFTPDIVLSPLSLPRELLESRCQQLLENGVAGAMRDILLQLIKRPTFSEQWPDQYLDGLIRGKRRIERLEQIRSDTITMDKILEDNDKEIYEWWRSIPS
jgi:hypothetical protein